MFVEASCDPPTLSGYGRSVASNSPEVGARIMNQELLLIGRLRNLLSREKAFKFGPDVRDDVCLKDAGVLDSFGLIALVVHLEAEFGIKVFPEEATFEQFHSILMIAEYLKKKIHADHRN
jgi:acyl carrier protein